MKTVGIIRCQLTEDKCLGTNDFRVAANGLKAFETVGDCEVIGFISCGGCPGTKIGHRVQLLEAKGAEVIAISSCISKGSPFKKVCQNWDKMQEEIENHINEKTILLNYTH